jgi:hypothetical protein
MCKLIDRHFKLHCYNSHIRLTIPNKTLTNINFFLFYTALKKVSSIDIKQDRIQASHIKVNPLNIF